MPRAAQHTARALCVLVLLGLVACGREASEPGAGAADPAPDRAAEAFEHLRALGYADWDEGADEELSGVVRFERERVSPGYNVYTNDRDEAYLCDLAGRRVHTWRLPGARQMETFELLEDGGVIALSVGECVVRLDWDSRVVWRKDVAVHHDVTRDPDGSFLVLWRGPGRDYQGRLVRFDGIGRFSARGRALERWLSWRDLEQLQQHHPPTPLDQPPGPGRPRAEGLHEYYHMNSLEVLPDTPLGRRDTRFAPGHLLVCLRNANTLAILSRESKEVLWSWGAEELQLPHMPTMLANGNILVFDNGLQRRHSRVLEVDPVVGAIVWRYVADPPESFFSPWRGSNQRLPNGNTLICESERGHAFEVDAGGEIVWEFWNPELSEGRRKRIYRFLRLAPEVVEPLLAARR